MKILTALQRRKLRANGERRKTDANFDPSPVVKLFTPGGAATWLLCELDPEEPDRAFGLCDLGLGYPELGYVSLRELQTAQDHLGIRIERDIHFRPKSTITAYANCARLRGRIDS